MSTTSTVCPQCLSSESKDSPGLVVRQIKPAEVTHALAEEREQPRLPFNYIAAHQGDIFDARPNGRARERTKPVPRDEDTALKAKHGKTAPGVVALLCADCKEVVVVQVERQAEVQGVQCGAAPTDELEEGLPAAAVINQERLESTTPVSGDEEDAVVDGSASAELKLEQAG
uniref:Uncharacterized protein n=1 Tax=Aegilops tauschii TaxID=37682 RepID=R7WF17_AEGTA